MKKKIKTKKVKRKINYTYLPCDITFYNNHDENPNLSMNNWLGFEEIRVIQMLIIDGFVAGVICLCDGSAMFETFKCLDLECFETHYHSHYPVENEGPL